MNNEFSFTFSIHKLLFTVMVAAIFGYFYDFIGGGFVGWIVLTLILVGSYFIYDNIISLADGLFGIVYNHNLKRVNELLESSTKKMKVEDDDIIVMEVESKKINYKTLLDYHEILENMFPKTKIIIIEKDMEFKTTSEEKLQEYVDKLQKIIDNREVANVQNK